MTRKTLMIGIALCVAGLCFIVLGAAGFARLSSDLAKRAAPIDQGSELISIPIFGLSFILMGMLVLLGVRASKSRLAVMLFAGMMLSGICAIATLMAGDRIMRTIMDTNDYRVCDFTVAFRSVQTRYAPVGVDCARPEAI